MDRTTQFQSLGYHLIQDCEPKFKELCEQAANNVDVFTSGKVKTLSRWKTKEGVLKQSLDVHQKSRCHTMLCEKSQKDFGAILKLKSSMFSIMNLAPL